MGHERHEGHAGTPLRILRDANELTLKEAAALAKCSESYLSQVERGVKTASWPWVARVTAVLAQRLREDRAA